ncbi:hypothetical protein CISIN_1g038728mg [Citrus sinensis]|uniref:Uncharacterized protein n=1 Tax=Citrus sinensis TaxID=2711 RepID=A0A067F1V9_CITSI|nr:hypothetical protein CISIN_1g038728mg [Citrus sinensis]
MRNPSQTAASGDSGVSSSEGGNARHVGGPVNPPPPPDVFEGHAGGHGRGHVNPPHPHVDMERHVRRPVNPRPPQHVFGGHAGGPVNPDVRERQARDPVNPPPPPDVFAGHAGGHGRGPVNPSPFTLRWEDMLDVL